MTELNIYAFYRVKSQHFWRPTRVKVMTQILARNNKSNQKQRKYSMKVKYFTPGLIKQTLLNIMLKPISNKGPDLIVTIIILKLLGEV